MGTQPLKVVFMGTPGFAARILEHVIRRPDTDVVTVITQPDRPKGRGKKMTIPPVKEVAEHSGLPIWQPATLSDPDAVDRLRSLKPDFLLVAAYGLILSPEILAIPKCNPLNVHASLLPKYRGAAPIQRALAHGEPVTGISIMCMQPGMDTGPVLMQRALAIGLEDTAATLHDELAELGGQLLVQTLDRFHDQDLVAVPQDERLATYAPKLRKEEGRIDWDRPAREVHNHIRAMHPWPGANTNISPSGGEKPVRVTVFPGRIGPEVEPGHAPGQISRDAHNVLRIACADRYYLVDTLKPSSRGPMSSAAFACGYLSQDCGSAAG